MQVWQMCEEQGHIAMRWKLLSRLFKNTPYMKYSETAVKVISKDI